MRALVVVTVLAVVTPSAARGQPAAKPAAATPPTAAAILTGVDTLYASIKTAALRFTQSNFTKAYGTTSTKTGRGWIARPDQMRWEYLRSKRGKKTEVYRVFLADASTITVVDHDTLQITSKPIARDLTPAALSFLTGKGTLAKAFTPVVVATTADSYTLELTPNQVSAATAKLTLVVDATTFEVRESTVEDSAGNTNHMVFHTTTRAKVDAKLFRFDPKAKRFANYQVVNLADAAP